LASYYERIGAELIRQAITEFYRRAETDGIIGHFFFNKNLADIIAKQITFATAMLGGPRVYKGKPLGPAHASLDLRGPHFDRRQVLMAEVLTEMGLADELRDAWMELEERLRPLIVQQKTYSGN
jgi:hemoglobin